jgi:hypothetical protein
MGHNTYHFHEFTISTSLNSWIWNHEFVKFISWICENKIVNFKLWIHESEIVNLWCWNVDIVNSWCWNRGLVKLKSWIHEFRMLKVWIHEVKIVNSHRYKRYFFNVEMSPQVFRTYFLVNIMLSNRGRKVYVVSNKHHFLFDIEEDLIFGSNVRFLFVSRYSWFVSRVTFETRTDFIDMSASLLEPYTSQLTWLGEYYNSFEWQEWYQYWLIVLPFRLTSRKSDYKLKKNNKNKYI